MARIIIYFMIEWWHPTADYAGRRTICVMHPPREEAPGVIGGEEQIPFNKEKVHR